MLITISVDFLIARARGARAPCTTGYATAQLEDKGLANLKCFNRHGSKYSVKCVIIARAGLEPATSR